MLPQNVLSTLDRSAQFLPPRNRWKHPLIEYELGGVDLNDASEGLEVKPWRLRYVEGSFVVDAAGVEPVTILTIDEVIRSCSLAFDQNMQPAIAWENVDDEAFLYWFDPTLPGFTTVTLPAGTRTPRITLDDHREIATLGGWSDIVLAYVRDDTLYHRLQRDRFLTEYTLQSGLDEAELDQVGMNELLSLQFRLHGGPTNIPAEISIERVLREICGRSGATRIDARDHFENLIDGYVISNASSGRSAIAPIRTVGLFDIVERGPEIRFPARGGATVAEISVDELGVKLGTAAPQPTLEVRKSQDVDLPRQIRLRYKSVARDYEQGEQLSRTRHGTESINDMTTDVPVMITDERAAQTADIMHREAWASRWSYTFSLGLERIWLEPGDPLLLPDESRLYRVRLTNIQLEGFTVLRCEAVRDDDGVYTSIAVAPTQMRPGSDVVMLGGTELLFLDLPALRAADDEAGFYMAARRTGIGTSWPGARVFRSIDAENYTQFATIANQVTIGEVVSAPADADPYAWDTDDELVVDIENGTLESRTDAAVLQGANAAAIGAPGRWQLIQFADAVLIQTGRYRLTRLLAGRRGTEHEIGTVLPGDTFVLVSGPGVIRVELAVNEIGADRIYRGVTNGAAFVDGVDQTYAGTGRALLPFSPAYAYADRDMSGNIAGWFIRRDRLADALLNGVDVPMSEDSEEYEIDVMDGPTVVRTIDSLTSPEFTYSAADQTTDFGSPQDPVTIRIYQLSADVGRGTPLEVTL